MILTLIVVILADVVIFVPSLARYRADYLIERLRHAQIAALTQLASDLGVDPALESELLANAGVYNVVLRRDDIRQLVLSSPVPGPVAADYDLRESGPWDLIRDALSALREGEDRVVRVLGSPVQGGGQLIEITMPERPLIEAMRSYAARLLGLSLLFSAVMAVLLYLAAQRLIVLPIARMVRHMRAYASAPEDARNVIDPQARVVELREAEEMFAEMQRRLTGALRQKERLAQLGGAVAKISHDLRNILTTAQLFADRMESSKDPMVARAAPKLVASISRAVNLCEATLAFGKAEEPEPSLTTFKLLDLVLEVVEGEGLAVQFAHLARFERASRGAPALVAGGAMGAGAPTGATGADVGFEAAVPDHTGAGGLVTALLDVGPQFELRADREQLYRVLSNLIRNARQAIEATGVAGVIEVSAGAQGMTWSGAEGRGIWIRVGDSGPGLPERARANLFAAFNGGVRKGGTGLGLAIAAELVRGHGGMLELLRSDDEGTEFLISLPASEKISEVQIIA